MNRYVLSSILLSGAIAACDEGAPESEYTGPAIEIAVAPLNLPGITSATYRLLIENSAPNSGTGNDVTGEGKTANNVVYLTGITSTQYGNGGGGDISYVAPCDASVTVDLDTGTPGNQNAAVTLWVEGLAGASGFENPCPLSGAGCTIFVACTENADTFVEFNLTIMREADQGFFDIAVNFEDIFCSGKLDSCYANGTTTCPANSNITLLHNAAGTARQHTAVGALACTASAGKETQLFVGKPSVTCGAYTFNLDLDRDGNGTVSTTVSDVTKTLRYAVYRGKEALTCDDASTLNTVESCGKVYLNFAINLGHLASEFPTTACTLNQYVATATEKNAPVPSFGAGVFTSQPVVQYGASAAGVTLVNGSGATQAFAHPLNVTGSGVTTQYKTSQFWAGPSAYFLYAP